MIGLWLVRRPDGAPPGPPRFELRPEGLTIGRASDCDIVLDDALRLVSRRHAWIVPQGADGALLRCISSSAALLVNGEPLAPQGERSVRDGDQVRIGGFELLVDGGSEATLAVCAVSAGAPAAPAADPPTMVLVRPPEPPQEPSRRSRLDRCFNLDHAADPLAPGSPLPVLDAAAMAALMPAARALSNSERAPAPEPVGMPEEAAPEFSAIAGADDALRNAFLRGAGLGAETPFAVDAASMERLGALLRAATDGMFELLRGRAAVKRGLRAEGTQLAARENNPLKFAPDGADALRLLLGTKSALGFLGPVDALRDAQRDLQLHQLAMIAAMRVAAFELITRLGPEATEAALGPTQGLADRLTPLREAALWRRYRELHAQLLETLNDHFEAVFGREFPIAYEAQSALAANAASAAADGAADRQSARTAAQPPDVEL
jgi:type VI secretion system FHA domain protein